MTDIRLDRRLGAACMVAALAADQLSKGAALTWLQPREVIEVTPFFNLRLGFNRGVSFGFLGDGAVGPLALSALGAAIVGALLIWMWRSASRAEAAAFGLVAGGAIGNIIDRLRRGAVTDFLDVHVAGWHWPTFNLGDSAITIGVTMMIAGAWWSKKPSGA